MFRNVMPTTVVGLAKKRADLPSLEHWDPGLDYLSEHESVSVLHCHIVVEALQCANPPPIDYKTHSFGSQLLEGSGQRA
jgi:hypothetical protein